MARLHIDFETQSAADLKKVGMRLYAEHPSTKILCIAFALDDADPTLVPFFGTGPASIFTEFTQNPDVTFVAHNAGFEMAIWENAMVKQYGCHALPIERWDCTMSKAFTYGLPGSLDGASNVMDSPFPKDKDGHKIMMKLSRPRRNGEFYQYEDCPDDFERLYQYCMRDVEAERWLDQQLRNLPPKERRIWEIDQRMNQAGIWCDIPVVVKAKRFAEIHHGNLIERFVALTDGAVGTPGQRDRLLLWCKENGMEIRNLKKDTVAKLLAADLPEPVREALAIRSASANTSLSKLPRILEQSDSRGVIREQFAYHGAHTGRKAGRGVQPQNFKRPGSVDVDKCINDLQRFNYDAFEFLYGDVSSTISYAMRGVVIAPPDCDVFVADLSQMEPRCVAWLAGQEDKLDVFRRGEDPYCVEASKLYSRPITKDDKVERQVGKVDDIACSYGGGIAAFDQFAKNYGLDMRPVAPRVIATATQQEMDKAAFCWKFYCQRTPKAERVTEEIGLASDVLKQRWRLGNKKIQEYWYVAENAAIEAVRTGRPVQCGKVIYFMNGPFLHCKLPSGRCTAYPFPQLRVDRVTARKCTECGGLMELNDIQYLECHQCGNTYKPRDDSLKLTYVCNKGYRIGTYGGKLVENQTQAMQRDVHMDVMLRCEDYRSEIAPQGYPWAFDVHDEGVAYVRKGYGDIDEYTSLFKVVPTWAPGLPVDAKGWSGQRYGKD